jgi:hypothetical protein
MIPLELIRELATLERPRFTYWLHPYGLATWRGLLGEKNQSSESWSGDHGHG